MNDINIIHSSHDHYKLYNKIEVEFVWNDRPFAICYINFDMSTAWNKECNQWEAVWGDEAWISFIDKDSGIMYQLMFLEDLEASSGNMEAEHVIAMLKQHIDDVGLPQFKEVENG